MFALLNPRVWIAVALAVVLAGTHFTAYRSGRDAVTEKWDVERLAQQTQRSDAERDNRAIEAKRSEGVSNADKKFQAQRSVDRVAANSANTELQRLRDVIASTSAPSETPRDPATIVCLDDLARTRDVFRRSATALQNMAVTADALETQLVGLQDYVRSITDEPKP